MVLHKSKKEKERCINESESDSDTSDEEREDLEALMARRLKRGKVKYKGKLPIICFPCNKVGHIAARCPDMDDKDEERKRKYKDKRENKGYRR